MPAGTAGKKRTTVPARQTESHTPYRPFLRQSVPHGTRCPAAQTFRCGVFRRVSCPQDRKTCGSRTLRVSFLHKWSSGTLAASFSFFFFPQRKRTKAFCLFQKGEWCSFLARWGKERKECATVPVDRICAKGLLLHAAPDTCLRRLRCASHGGKAKLRAVLYPFALSSAFFLCHNAMRRIAGQPRSADTGCSWELLRLRARESSAVSVCVRVPPAARSFASAGAAVLFCIRLFQIESMISESKRISVLRPFRSAYRMVFQVPPFSTPFHTANTRSALSTIYILRFCSQPGK